MAEILFDSQNVLVDPDRGHFAVGKEDTIIATDPGIAKKAFDAMKEFIKNAKTGITHIFDVGSKKESQMDHEGNTIAQRKMSSNEVGKYSSFLANVGKNIEKGLSKLGKSGKVAMVVGAMLLTAAMSQQLHAAKYVETSFDEVVKKAAANPGVQYLYQESGSEGFKMMMAITPETKEASKENLNVWGKGGIISNQGDIKPGDKNTCFAIYPLTDEGNRLVKESDEYTVYLDGKKTPETGTKQEKSTISISMQAQGGNLVSCSYTDPKGKEHTLSGKKLDEAKKIYQEKGKKALQDKIGEWAKNEKEPVRTL